MINNKPNILWIMTDEQRVDSLGCYDSKWAYSPNIDKIASDGIRFSNCVIQGIPSIPSRAALLTGRYTHACRGMVPMPNIDEIALSSIPLSKMGFSNMSDETPLTCLFRDAGYQVVNIGKCDYPDREHYPFEIDCGGPGYGGPAATLNSLKKPYKPEDYDVITVPNQDHAPEGLQGIIVGGKYPLPKEEAEPGLIAKRCKNFFAEEAKLPFFLRVAFIAPHTPVLAAEPFYGMTDPHKIDLSIGTKDELKTKSRYESENLVHLWPFYKFSEEELTKVRTSYYDRCIQVDDAIGMILKSLQRYGYDDNTIIAFNSDHGTLLGEHGLGQKRNFYDPTIKVGLIFSWAGHIPENRVVTDPVELIDFMPTMMSLTGLGIPQNVHGQNLAPQMLGERSIPDRPTFCEMDNTGSEAYGPCGSHMVMVRDGKWKLSYALTDAGYGEDGTLYDLENDPDELNNLYNRPAYKTVINDLKKKIMAWQAMK